MLKDQKGVTLIELIIAISLISILSLASVGNAQIREKNLDRYAERLSQDIKYCKSMTTQTDLNYSISFDHRSYSIEKVNYRGEIMSSDKTELAKNLTWGVRPDHIRFSGINDLELIGTSDKMLVEIYDRQVNERRDITIVPVSNRIALKKK